MPDSNAPTPEPSGDPTNPIQEMVNSLFKDETLASQVPAEEQAFLKEAMPQIMLEFGQEARRGVEVFLHRDQQNISQDVMERFRARLASWEDVSAPPEVNDICSQEEWNHLLGIAAEALHNNEVEAARAMYATLQCIRPEAPQPYIGSYTVMWKLAGAEAAALLYESTMPFMEESPTFLYFAAECFAAARRHEQAHEAIDKVLKLVTDENSGITVHPEFVEDIKTLHGKITGTSQTPENYDPTAIA